MTGHEFTMPQQPGHTDILFISEQPLWPMDQGYRVHGCHMARALSQSGLGVRMASLRPTVGGDHNGLGTLLADWPGADDDDRDQFLAGWAGRGEKLRHKLASHQALDPRELAGLIPLVRRLQPRTVIALGQHGPVMLRGLRHAFPDITTVWYAADEPVFFQLSCLRREGIFALKRRAYLAGLYGSLQRLFAKGLDAAIGVSPMDARLLKLTAGVRRSVNIPNGVDADRYQPSDTRPRPGSLVFWGRLDFEPNADAVRWFAHRVWPRLRERQPQAKWRIVGKGAGEKIRQLGDWPGIEFVGEVGDIRPYAHAAAATILPMRCGGGIKNKLLEAAAMGLPILASPKAVKGLSWPAHTSPVRLCRGPDDWVHQIERVWYDGVLNNRLRSDARRWMLHQHTWLGAADKLQALLQTIDATRSDDRRNIGSTPIGIHPSTPDPRSHRAA